MPKIEFKGVIKLAIVISLLLNALALIITSYIVPGFEVSGFVTAIFAAIILGFINTFIRPVLLILTAPINLLTLGLFTFVVNAALLWLASMIIPGIMIDNFLAAIFAAIVLSVVSTALSAVFKDLSKK